MLQNKKKWLAFFTVCAIFCSSVIASAAQPLVGLGTEKKIERKQKAEQEPEEKRVVAIDPGHQGSWVDMSAQEPIAPGASETKAKATTGTQGAYTGLEEYELNLQVSLCLCEELEDRGYEVVMTREDNDAAISNSERAQLAAEKGAEILVRIHANGSTDHSVNGALAMIPSKENPYVGDLYEDCYSLGEKVLDGYCMATGIADIGVQCYDNMSGINWSTIPVTILEMGFMSNESDDRMMAEPDSWPVMAGGIADGIDAYFAEKTESTTEQSTENASESDLPLGELEDFLYVYLSENTEKTETWAVAVMDPETKDQILVNSQQMQAASLIKLYIMGAVYETYDELSAEYTKEEIDRLLELMITISDNDAANTLVSYLGDQDTGKGMEAVNDFCRKWNYSDTVMGRLLLAPADHGDNLTSVKDCADFLYKADQNEFEHGDSMMELLKKQQRTHKIPNGIPGGIVVANKTGELDTVENDVAVIFAEKPYILCVMSEHLNDAGRAQNEIAELSGQVFLHLFP